MKKYFSYLIYGLVIIVFLAVTFDISRQIKNLIFDNVLTHAQVGGDGAGGDSSNYSLDYCGDCNGLYCYNAPGAHICPGETTIKSGQQMIIALKEEIIYLRNRIQAEREDLLVEISRLNNLIDYYTKKIDVENKELQQLQNDNARKLAQIIISMYENQKQQAEIDKLNKEELSKHFESLAKPNGLINQLAAEVLKTSEQIDECLLNGIKECTASCSGGCHDTTGCVPGSGGGLGGIGGLGDGGDNGCSGGTPSVCSIDNLDTIQDLKSKINSEIQTILDIINRIEN